MNRIPLALVPLALLLGPPLTACAQNQQVEHQGWALQSAGKPWSLQRVKDGFRFEVRPGDEWANDEGRQPPHDRAELEDQRKMRFGQAYEVAWTQTITPTGPFTTKELVFAQLHATDEPGDKVRSGPIADLRVGWGVFSVRASYSLDDPTGTPVYLTLFNDAKPYDFGRPIRYRVYMKTSRDAQDGVLKVWRDDVQLVDYAGPLGYVNEVGPYWKMGVYRLRDEATVVAEVSDLRGPQPSAPAQ